MQGCGNLLRRTPGTPLETAMTIPRHFRHSKAFPKNTLLGWSMSPKPKIPKITNFRSAFSTGRSAPMALEIGAIERSRRVDSQAWSIFFLNSSQKKSYDLPKSSHIGKIKDFRWFVAQNPSRSGRKMSPNIMKIMIFCKMGVLGGTSELRQCSNRFLYAQQIM